MDALQKAGFDVAGKSVMVFGTGGAAKAVLFILNWLRAGAITIAGRDFHKTRAVADRVGGEPLSLSALREHTFPAELVVNATSVSSPEEASEMAALVGSLSFPACKLIMDLNYGRPQNFWQTAAERNRIPFMDGLTSLAYQAKRSFALWTGIQVPAEAFFETLARAVL